MHIILAAVEKKSGESEDWSKCHCLVDSKILEQIGQQSYIQKHLSLKDNFA